MTGPIGVVIPLFNKSGLVRRAVESVLHQTFTDLRVVVVDDGSSDDSAHVVERIGDPRLEVLRAGHRGPGAARNLGMRSLDTEWIGLLDADDEWHPSFLEKTRSAVHDAPEVVAVFTAIHVRDSPPARRAPVAGLIDDYHGTRLRHRVAMSSSSVLLNRKRFLAAGGFREGYRYAEDTEAWFRLACEGLVYYIPEPLCEIELNVAGATTTSAHASERVQGLQKLLDSYDHYRRALRIPARQVDSCRRFMQHQRGRLAVHLCASGRTAAGIRELLTGVPVSRWTWREYVHCIRCCARA
jgi:glycosyltransferase involved in cell wall biosynthesis